MKKYNYGSVPSIYISNFIKNNYYYDLKTGLLYSALVNRVVGRLSNKGYLRVDVKGYTISVHRIAYFLVTGSWPTFIIDHLNRVKTDNRWSNLRHTNFSVNNANRDITSKVYDYVKLGLNPYEPLPIYKRYRSNQNRWLVEIKIKGKTKHLKSFKTEELADSFIKEYLDRLK